jgi:hypothetical protein
LSLSTKGIKAKFIGGKAPMTKQPIQSPYLPIINRQGLIMLKAASELGFTPASCPRTQVLPLRDLPNAGDGQGEEDFDTFLPADPNATLQYRGPRQVELRSNFTSSWITPASAKQSDPINSGL